MSKRSERAGSVKSRASTHKSGGKIAKKYEGKNCELCQDCTIPATKRWRKHVFHAEPCWRGMRNHHQQLGKLPGALAEDAKLFDEDRPQWRKENAPHCDPDKEVRAEARHASKAKYKVSASVKKKLRVKPVLELKKRHYKGWKRTWENMSSDEASACFDEDYDKQGLMKCLPLYRKVIRKSNEIGGFIVFYIFSPKII